MSNVYEFPRKKNDGSEELEFPEAIKKYYENLCEPESVVNYAYERAKKYKSEIDDSIIFTVNFSSIKNNVGAEGVHKEIQTGIENLCKKYNSEHLKLRAKLVQAEVRIYKFENNL